MDSGGMVLILWGITARFTSIIPKHLKAPMRTRSLRFPSVSHPFTFFQGRPFPPRSPLALTLGDSTCPCASERNFRSIYIPSTSPNPNRNPDTQ